MASTGANETRSALQNRRLPVRDAAYAAVGVTT